MGSDMRQMRETANAHMRQDIQSGWKWVCECDDCREIRSLIGVDKTLEVRELVRRIDHLETSMQRLPEGPDMDGVKAQYLKLHDELAAVMAK
ncbi:MAG TPA: hypothetical protein VGJ15_05895 [Pirellulales bacterium]|jgi:hypothetical protein